MLTVNFLNKTLFDNFYFATKTLIFSILSNAIIISIRFQINIKFSDIFALKVYFIMRQSESLVKLIRFMLFSYCYKNFHNDLFEKQINLQILNNFLQNKRYKIVIHFTLNETFAKTACKNYFTYRNIVCISPFFNRLQARGEGHLFLIENGPDMPN